MEPIHFTPKGKDLRKQHSYANDKAPPIDLGISTNNPFYILFLLNSVSIYFSIVKTMVNPYHDFRAWED